MKVKQTCQKAKQTQIGVKWTQVQWTHMQVKRTEEEAKWRSKKRQLTSWRPTQLTEIMHHRSLALLLLARRLSVAPHWALMTNVAAATPAAAAPPAAAAAAAAAISRGSWQPACQRAR
jgi:hypothetical protein